MRINLYLHGGKEAAWEAGYDAGLRADALKMFKFAGSEHKMTYAVNKKTGVAMLVEVDGQKLGRKSQ